MIRSILRSHLIPGLIPGLILAPLAACGPSYSPNTYSANAAQQANKADQGVIIGVRPVRISATGTVGTVTGAAAGGIAGSENGVGVVSAFSALGGSLVGGLAGSAVEHATSDTDAFEYIVQKKGTGDLVSITQKDKVPLALGEKVLVIAGNQARVVPDYTDSQLEQASKPAGAKTANAATSGAASTPKTDKAADAAAPPMNAAVAEPTAAEAVPADAAAVGAALSGAKPSTSPPISLPSSPSNTAAGDTSSASAPASAPTDGLLPPGLLPAGAIPSGGLPAASAAAAADRRGGGGKRDWQAGQQLVQGTGPGGPFSSSTLPSGSVT